jgi:hypothetical protein
MRRTKGMAGAAKALGMVVICVALDGCPGKSGEGDGGSDAGPVDSGQPCDSPAGACAPLTCSTGNEHHVGAYCTHGGRQCGAYGIGALQCAIDLDPRGGDYCILVGCAANSDCGTGACCNGDPSISTIFACAPMGCVTDAGTCPQPPFPDAGVDGGSLDGGSTDGGTTDGGNTQDGGACVSSPPGTCLPTTCSTGDSEHVGAYCTKGGGQCAAYGNLLLGCSIDLSSDGDNFCILTLCGALNPCTADACCYGGPDAGPTDPRACVPIGCLVMDGGVCPP